MKKKALYCTSFVLYFVPVLRTGTSYWYFVTVLRTGTSYWYGTSYSGYRYFVHVQYFVPVEELCNTSKRLLFECF